MTKGLRFGLGSGLVFGLLAAAHATDPLSLVTNHATVLACTDCDVPGMPLFTTFGSEMRWNHDSPRSTSFRSGVRPVAAAIRSDQRSACLSSCSARRSRMSRRFGSRSRLARCL